MSLYEDFKVLVVNSMRMKTSNLSFLRFLDAAIQNVAIAKKFEINDSVVVEALEKEEKKLNEELSYLRDSTKLQELQSQIQIVKSFLPTKLTLDETRAELEVMVQGKTKKDFGLIMKDIKQNKPNMSTSVASAILKELLV